MNAARVLQVLGVVIVVVAAIGVIILIMFFANVRLAGSPPEPAPVTTTSPVQPYDEAAEHGGDGTPHQAENRGHLQPKDLPTEAEQRLNAEGTRLLPTLETVRAAGNLTPDAVRDALLAAGYPADSVATTSRTSNTDGTPYVVFGIAADGGCVTGLVSTTEVRAQAMGPYPEWGCLPPDTH